MKNLKLLICLASFAVTSLYTNVEADCKSCEVRRKSHKDDLKNSGYYEDTPYYKDQKNGKGQVPPPPESQPNQPLAASFPRDLEQPSTTETIKKPKRSKKKTISTNNNGEQSN